MTVRLMFAKIVNKEVPNKETIATKIIQNSVIFSDVGRPTFLPLSKKSSLQNIDALTQYKSLMTQKMQHLYPEIMLKTFTGKIAYTARMETPQEMIARGGLMTGDNLWLSNTGSGDNKGAICFSFLPEIASLFVRGNKATLYAFPLYGDFLCPGGKWRQVIAPGAFPITTAWLAREVIEVKNNKAYLGPIVGHAWNFPASDAERFEHFLSEFLMSPPTIDFGEDSPYEYVITDTAWTQTFHSEVMQHYRSINCKL